VDVMHISFADSGASHFIVFQLDCKHGAFVCGVGGAFAPDPPPSFFPSGISKNHAFGFEDENIMEAVFNNADSAHL
jgi:hypothetical protein